MSIRLMADVFECDLPTNDRFVLLSLADYANDEGHHVYPSVATIVRKTGLSESTVHRSLTYLEEQGYLLLVRQGGGRQTNEWRINPDKVRGVSETPQGCHGDTSGVSEGHPIHQLTNQLTYEDCTVEGEPVQVPKKKDTSLYRMAEALASVTGMSIAINKSALFAEAKELVKDIRVSPELIVQTYSPGGVWYTQDWRGKTGQKPRLYDIRSTLFTFEVTPANTVRGGLKDVVLKGGLK